MLYDNVWYIVIAGFGTTVLSMSSTAGTGCPGLEWKKVLRIKDLHFNVGMSVNLATKTLNVSVVLFTKKSTMIVKGKVHFHLNLKEECF